MNEGEILDLPVAEIGPGPLVRKERLDEAHAELLRPMLDEVPPVIVRETAGGWSLIDGQHRLSAAKLEQRETIRAVVVALSDAEALEAAVKANTSHGKALTLSERKAAAAQLIAETDWSDRRIAAACGLHRVTVGKARPVDVVENDHLRTGRDGKTYPAGESAAVRAARERREREAAETADPVDYGPCTAGFECAAKATGPDQMCAWHRGKLGADKACEPKNEIPTAEAPAPSPSDPQQGSPSSDPAAGSTGKAGTEPPTDAAAPGEGTGLATGPAVEGPGLNTPAPPASLQLDQAAERAAVSADMVAARRLLTRDPAEVLALMTAEDDETWSAHADDMADWAHRFFAAKTDRNRLRSV